jgi:quinoprotein glucose dehydrogenase
MDLGPDPDRQVVHHDLWDYDVAAQPLLLTIRRDGKDVPAVAAATKTGHVFLLDRKTGKPLYPVEERPVPKSAGAGEEAWPTQPFPTFPDPLVPQKLSPEDAWGTNPEGLIKDSRAGSRGVRAPRRAFLPRDAGWTRSS